MMVEWVVTLCYEIQVHLGGIRMLLQHLPAEVQRGAPVVVLAAKYCQGLTNCGMGGHGRLLLLLLRNLGFQSRE